MNNTDTSFETFSSWRQWYFIGIAQNELGLLTIDQSKLQSLFSLTKTEAVLSCGAPLDPRLIINHKGTTVWLMLFAMPFVNDKPGLQAVAQGKCTLQIPAPAVRNAFSGHINWPASILEKYPIELKQGHLFVLPFLRHSDLSAPIPLSRSVKAPDGSIEVLSCQEFDDTNPESMMRVLAEVCAAAGSRPT